MHLQIKYDDLKFILASPENGTFITLVCTKPNWYLDLTDTAFLTKMDIECTNNG
jgi:hypothetical protein